MKSPKSPNAKYFNWLIHRETMQIVAKHAPLFSGILLDIGCGKKPYQEILGPYVSTYIGIEYTNTLHGIESVDVVATGLQLPFAAKHIDHIVSFQVLEHIPEPADFLAEAYRVLRPGGYMLVMTPFMWGEHEKPYDFYRYTQFGLRYLAEKAGFEVITIEPYMTFWETIILRINYWTLRYARGPLRIIFKPLLWGDQYIAKWIGILDKKLSFLAQDKASLYDYASGFSMLLTKLESEGNSDIP